MSIKVTNGNIRASGIKYKTGEIINDLGADEEARLVGLKVAVFVNDPDVEIISEEKESENNGGYEENPINTIDPASFLKGKKSKKKSTDEFGKEEKLSDFLDKIQKDT